MSEAVEQKAKNEVMVMFSKEGLVEFNNQKELSNAAQLLVQMNLAPDHLKKDGVTAVMSALTFCKQYQLPYAAMNELAYIKGKMGPYGSLYTAIAQRHPDYGEMKVLYTDKEMNIINLANKNLNADVWACVIMIKKKSDSDWHEYFFTKDEAQKAGLLGGATKTYEKYLKDMLYHKAKSRAFNTEYASVLKGIDMAENLIMDDAVRDVSPVERLNERLKLREVKNEPAILSGPEHFVDDVATGDSDRD